MQEKTRKKRHESSIESGLPARCHALNVAISKGVIIKANIQGSYRQLISIKSEQEKVTFLFHDDLENLCMFQVAPGRDRLEFLLFLPVA